jgi:hypothetical protein
MIPTSRDFAYARVGKRCAFIARPNEQRDYWVDVWPAGKGDGICGRLPREGTCVVRKLRHRSSGIAATHINAS